MSTTPKESYTTSRAEDLPAPEEHRPGFMAVVDAILEQVPDDAEHDPLETLRTHYGYDTGEELAAAVAAIAATPGPDAEADGTVCPDCREDVDAGMDVDPHYRVQYREIREEPRFRQDSEAYITQFFVYKCSRHPDRYFHIGSAGHA